MANKIGGGDSIVRNFRVVLKDENGKLARAWEFENINRRQLQVRVGDLINQGLLPKGPEKIKKLVDVQEY